MNTRPPFFKAAVRTLEEEVSDGRIADGHWCVEQVVLVR